jgi:hypothetical protein
MDKVIDIDGCTVKFTMIIRGRCSFVEAEHILRQMLQRREKMLGMKNLDMINCMHHLAPLLSNQGRHIKAVQKFHQFLKLR